MLLSSKVTAPQDAHGRLVLQVYLGSNTLELKSLLVGLLLSYKTWILYFLDF